MAGTVNVNTVIRSVVAAEVKAVLEPYRNVLERMAAFIGAPARRGPGRPRKTPLAAASPRRGGRRPKNPARAAKKLSEGQAVQYKQGRGTFDARITKVDAATGAIHLERVKDGKKVVRPAHKVLAG